MSRQGRSHDELRPIRINTGFQQAATGSALIQWGDTWVLCAASAEETVPPFRERSGGGWVTAEYAMLPGSTQPRKRRRAGGREAEIQRLIGRSLRMAIDLDKLGPRTITVDCDVIRADGGTRCAAITGGYIALGLAVQSLMRTDKLTNNPLKMGVAAVSTGLVKGRALLDLCYEEDAGADVDMNVVMTQDGRLVELQGTAEKQPFGRQQLDALADLGWLGIKQLLAFQQQVLDADPQTTEYVLSSPT